MSRKFLEGLDCVNNKIINLLNPTGAQDAATKSYVDSTTVTGWIDVKRSGALGDGVTDDTSAINTAISTSAVGSTIWFPPGTYKVTSTIVLYPNRTYLGAGGLVEKSIIQATSAVTGSILAAQGWTTNATSSDNPIKISGLCIQGPGQTTGSAHGLTLLNFWSRMEDLFFVNVAGDGIHMSDKTVNGTNTITNSASENTIHKCRLDTIGGTGIYQITNNGQAFLDGQIEDCYLAAIKGDGISLNNSAGWYVQRNHLYGITGNAIKCGNGFATHVEDNYVEDFGGANVASTTYYGIVLGQQSFGWPSTISGNFVANIQAGATNAPAASTSWQNYDLWAVGNGAMINFVNNTAWRSSSQGALNQCDAFTFEGDGSTLTVLSEGNQAGVSSGLSWRTIFNVLTGVTFAPSARPSVVTGTYAATYTTDCSLGSQFRITLTGNITLANPINATDGQTVKWELIQDATGSRTLTLGSNFVTGSDIGTPTLTTTASKRDYLQATYDAPAGKWHVTALARGY